MLPRIEDKPKQIKQQPWYRERIREKYLTKNPNNKEKLLNAKEWVFIKDGLDDFRDGFPPTHENVIIKVVCVNISVYIFKYSELTTNKNGLFGLLSLKKVRLPW